MAQTFKVLIEIPQDTVNKKYEYDHKTKKMVLDFVFENVVWPYNYGEILNAKGGDGDALDAIVLSQNPLEQGSRVECQAIGILEMLDRGEVDNKVICVPVNDPFSLKYKDLSDIPSAWQEEWQKFLFEIARQKKKVIKIMGFYNKTRAELEIKKSLIK